MPPCPPPLKYPRTAAPVSLYSYTTFVKSPAGKAVLGVQDVFFFKRSLFPFGDYAVIRTELCDAKRKYVAFVSNEGVGGDPSGKAGAICSGEMPQLEMDDYDTILHIIAVHPVEVKIPFVLRNVSLPKP